MNPNKLTRQAIRLAQREGQRRGHVLTRDEVLRLSVQTVDTWKRAFFALFGLSICGFALFCHLAGAPWWISGPFGASCIGVVVIGLVGKKEYLEREIQKMGKEGPTRFADAVINALI
jgi:hypothetical protein